MAQDYISTLWPIRIPFEFEINAHLFGMATFDIGHFINPNTYTCIQKFSIMNIDYVSK